MRVRDSLPSPARLIHLSRSARTRSIGVIVFLSALGLLALDLTASGGTPASGPTQRAREFADFLVHKRTVVEGEIGTISRVQLATADDDAARGATAFAYEFQVVVKQLLSGRLTEPTILIRVSERIAPTHLRTGDRVVAWGSPLVASSRQMTGALSQITPGEVLAAPLPGIRSLATGVSVPELAKQLRQLTNRHSLIGFDGERGLGLVRVDSLESSEVNVTFWVTPLANVIGAKEQLPQRLVATTPTDCGHSVLPGDTLLVPVSNRHSLECSLALCPDAAVIHAGLVVGPHVLLADLGSEFRNQGGRLVFLGDDQWSAQNSAARPLATDSPQCGAPDGVRAPGAACLGDVVPECDVTLLGEKTTKVRVGRGQWQIIDFMTSPADLSDYRSQRWLRSARVVAVVNSKTARSLSSGQRKALPYVLTTDDRGELARIFLPASNGDSWSRSAFLIDPQGRLVFATGGPVTPGMIESHRVASGVSINLRK